MDSEVTTTIRDVIAQWGADWRDNPRAIAERIERALDEKGYEIVQKEDDE